MRRYCLTSMDAPLRASTLDRRVTLCRDARSVRPLYQSETSVPTNRYTSPHFHYPYDLLHF